VRNVAVVPVFDNLPFDWVQDDSMLRRALKKLDEIRELNHLVILAKDVKAVNEHVKGKDSLETQATLQVMKLTQKSNAGIFGLLRWFDDNARNSDNVMYIVLDPLFPFLDGSKVQRVLYSALSNPSRATLTSRHGFVSKGSLTGPGKVIVPACFSLTGELIQQVITDGKSDMDFGVFESVPITSIEAVEYRLECGKRLTEALEFVS